MGVLPALLGSFAMVPGWYRMDPDSDAARERERRFLRKIADGFLSDIRVNGVSGGPGTLYVSNHISWLDILVLGGTIDANFVSKDDVARWPLLGGLARRSGTLFVARGRRNEVRQQTDLIGARLRKGGSLILFPEGTTSDGRTILPFRSSLFAAAEMAARIQPIALVYRAADGSPLTSSQQDVVGWTGDETLLGNAVAVSRIAVSGHVELLEPIVPHPGLDRRELADRCREAVVRAFTAAAS